jgi:hypothetical protein
MSYIRKRFDEKEPVLEQLQWADFQNKMTIAQFLLHKKQVHDQYQEEWNTWMARLQEHEAKEDQAEKEHEVSIGISGDRAETD